MKNRGLVAHKAKINRNPRVKKREQYRKALIRRKGAVREIRTDEGHVYGGEATGIKSGISRSRKLNWIFEHMYKLRNALDGMLNNGPS